MKPIAPDTLGVEALRNREVIGDTCCGRGETPCRSTRLGAAPADRMRSVLNGREVIRLMQRRKRNVALETEQAPHRSTMTGRSYCGPP